ncbi:antibiotic biosynthesis monooxygenase family protein [Paraferrimonas sedimenticola]|uniref:Antibiotic biosynthesis monooxygenase n=1 Tax=Paraferrimonas sedimenticola TaxID=375674 RepID=A0AA37RUP4_9GAMM|nr:antibiotic biosynthesis monooxygenase [Paraferrimonas sedimenticola]GLP95571.1 hypothetical protein GCM10007895_08770 [Paraferrimonas sedimenticola]
MLVVIFRATTAELDPQYTELAVKLRDKAIREYGCLEFVSACEGKQEIALSYWPDLASIKAWQADPEHRRAQVLGKQLWYSDYQVQIAQIGDLRTPE